MQNVQPIFIYWPCTFFNVSGKYIVQLHVILCLLRRVSQSLLYFGKLTLEHTWNIISTKCKKNRNIRHYQQQNIHYQHAIVSNDCSLKERERSKNLKQRCKWCASRHKWPGSWFRPILFTLSSSWLGRLVCTIVIKSFSNREQWNVMR